MPVSVPVGSLEKQQLVMIQGYLELESSKQLVLVVVFEKYKNIFTLTFTYYNISAI